nr:MAG TPA: hypothetical protein [Caudoviricetes sp.]
MKFPFLLRMPGGPRLYLEPLAVVDFPGQPSKGPP